MAFFPNLPQVQTFDPNQPVQNMMAAQDRNRQQSMENIAFKNSLADRDRKIAAEKENQAFERDKKIKDALMQEMAGLNPDSPTFKEDKMGIAERVGNLAFQAGIDPAQIREGAQAFLNGVTSETARAWRQKNGLELSAKDKPKTTQDIFSEEYAKAAGKAAGTPENTPTTAMAAYLKQKPNATPEEIVAFSQQLKGKGISVTLPDGTVMQVGGGSADMTPPTKKDIEGKLLSNEELYSRISAINSEFKPEYQEIGSRLENAWTGLKAKMGADVSKEDASKLIEFKQYQRKSIENINLYIKEMTGAQMSEKEADRLRLAQPDPGEKWWQGDDPITFKAKLNDVQKYTRAAIARYRYYKNQGLTDNEVTKLINSGEAVTLESLVSGME